MRVILLLMSFLILTNMISGQEKTIYDFKLKDIDGLEFDMASLKGKKVLIVNVASKCGLTPQYAELETLYQKYKDDNFVIIAFPSRNFLFQEFKENKDIKEFCQLNYGVSFPIMARISVKGKEQAGIYKWLTEKKQNGVMDAPVSWNFQKFMIDEEGRLVGMIPPKESPMSEKIIKWIEGE